MPVEICDYPTLYDRDECCGDAPCSIRLYRPCDAEGGCWERSTCGDCSQPLYKGDPGYDDDGPVNPKDPTSIKAEVLRAEAANTFPFPGGRGVARVQEATDV